MNCALVPIPVYVFAERLHFIGDKSRLRRLMDTPVNYHRRISEGARESMQTVQSCLM
jgi:hypothetical protein